MPQHVFEPEIALVQPEVMPDPPRSIITAESCLFCGRTLPSSSVQGTGWLLGSSHYPGVRSQEGTLGSGAVSTAQASSVLGCSEATKPPRTPRPVPGAETFTRISGQTLRARALRGYPSSCSHLCPGEGEEPRHSLRSCCSPCCRSDSPTAFGAGPARTRASLAAVPGLFPKSVHRRVVSSSPKRPTLQQICSMSSAYVNTGFDVCGIAHIHVCFLPCFFGEKRKGINDCQFIPVSQHLRACSPGRTASTCSRTHTCLPCPEDNKYWVLDANNCEKLKLANTDDLVSSS